MKPSLRRRRLRRRPGAGLSSHTLSPRWNADLLIVVLAHGTPDDEGRTSGAVSRDNRRRRRISVAQRLEPWFRGGPAATDGLDMDGGPASREPLARRAPYRRGRGRPAGAGTGHRPLAPGPCL